MIPAKRPTVCSRGLEVQNRNKHTPFKHICLLGSSVRDPTSESNPVTLDSPGLFENEPGGPGDQVRSRTEEPGIQLGDGAKTTAWNLSRVRIHENKNDRTALENRVHAGDFLFFGEAKAALKQLAMTIQNPNYG